MHDPIAPASPLLRRESGKSGQRIPALNLRPFRLRADSFPAAHRGRKLVPIRHRLDPTVEAVEPHVRGQGPGHEYPSCPVTPSRQSDIVPGHFPEARERIDRGLASFRKMRSEEHTSELQ